MADTNRRDFLKKGATAALGIGAVGTLSGGLAAGCTTDAETAAAAASTGTKYALNEAKYRQLTSFPEVQQEFSAALDEVVDGLLSDPDAYASFMESTDALGNLKVFEANSELLTALVGETESTTKRGRLKRILAVSEMYDGAASLENPGFLDSLASSSSSSSGGCATNGSPTNGCCVIHTWGWSSGDGLCSGIEQQEY